MKYDYTAGSTVTNVLNDIVSLLTGTTNMSTLSANCIQISSALTSDGSRLAGWTVWDASSGVGTVCVRALNVDGTTYKYMVIAVDSNVLTFKVYESWNATTHVGTNMSVAAITAQSSALSSGGTLYMSYSASCVIACTRINGVYTNSVFGILEHSRNEPWDTTALNIPPYGAINMMFGSTANGGNGAGYMYSKPRRKNWAGSDYIGDMGKLQTSSSLPSAVANVLTSSPITMVRDSTGGSVHAMCQIIAYGNHITYYGETQLTGTIFDIYITTSGFGGTADEILFNGKTYFIIAQESTRIAVPKF